VNRVWQHLFGRGLVETSDNFGLTGSAPTHPELLEWLAARFAADRQRLKPLIRLMVTSTAYRQASSITPSAAGSEHRPHAGDPRIVDPDNALLWRARLRRLEGEAVRDAILAASGRLDRTVGGPPIPVESRSDGTFVVSDKSPQGIAGTLRRSLYLLSRRNYHPTLLSVFDQPNLTASCTRRQSSAVVLQSLTMLNDSFVQTEAEEVARRVLTESSSDTDDRIRAAFIRVLGRPPNRHETQWSREFLKQVAASYGEKVDAAVSHEKALGYLCHVLLNSSEFLYTP